MTSMATARKSRKSSKSKPRRSSRRSRRRRGDSVGGWEKYVGRKFKTWSIKHHKMTTYRAESYDPSHGFWMVNEEDPTDRRDVSERVIGRTYHEVR